MADAKKSSIQKKSGCYLMNIKQPERTAKRLKLNFQRLKATIVTLSSGAQVDSAVGLVDLSETGAGFFTSQLLSKGVAVEVCITNPMVLKVRALVAWSVPIVSGVAGTRYPCRSGLQFIYDNEEQRAALKDFIEKVGSDPVDHYRRTLTNAPSKGQGQNSDIAPQVTGMADAAAVDAVLNAMAPGTPGEKMVAPIVVPDATGPNATSLEAAAAAAITPTAAPAVAPAASPAPVAEAAPAAAPAVPDASGTGENNGGQSQAA